MTEYWPVVVVGVLVVTSVTHHRLVRAAQPLRLELAEKGERLLANPTLSAEMRGLVRFMLDTTFNMRGPLLFGILAVPAIAVAAILRPAEFFKKDIEDPSAQALFFEVRRLHDRITLANHPILLPLVEFEILFFMPFAIVLIGLMHGRIPMKGDRDAVMSAIEIRELTHRRAA